MVAESPTPGEIGPAVLAGHLSWNGVDGVFRHLQTLKPGDEIVVTRADGSRPRFVVTEVAQYSKNAFPTARVYANTPEATAAADHLCGRLQPGIAQLQRQRRRLRHDADGLTDHLVCVYTPSGIIAVMSEHAHHQMTAPAATWGMARQATLHCLTGCAIGEVLGMVIGTALGWPVLPTVVLAIVLAFFFGYLLTMRGVLGPVSTSAGGSYRAGRRRHRSRSWNWSTTRCSSAFRALWTPA